MRDRTLNVRTLALAIAADAAFGDPQGWPHPVRLFGWTIERSERAVRERARTNALVERIGGFAIAVGIVGGTWSVAACSLSALREVNDSVAAFCDVALGSTTIAARDLLIESGHVRDALEAGDIPLARTRVARIVGRDTMHLEATEIARATIETLAESLCDGIVAPMLALAVGGVPAALAFKAASTLDSMLGHIEAPYTHLGYASAKLDDALCWLPARIAALLVIVAAPIANGNIRQAFAVLRADGAKHASPNAGRTEAAMAGALGIRLGGSNRYDGIDSHAPELGAAYAAPHIPDVRRAERIVIAATAACALLSLGIRALVDRA